MQILFQQKDFLILDKPAGVSCHNADDHSDVLGWVQKTTKSESVHLVNRLDAVTSGLVLVALNPSTAHQLIDAISLPSCKKNYRAIVRGSVKENSGTWSFPLTDKAEGRRDPQGKGDLKECVTHFKVLSQNQYFSYLDIEIETGRQHQIRRHAALARHAVVGDTRYSDLKYVEKIKEIYGTERLFLHAYQLHFVLGSEVIEVVSPVPSEFGRLIS